MFSADLGVTPSSANYIEDVFSTYLYTGNGSTQTITNGIDLSGKGGLVWTKQRTGTYSHNLIDTARGRSKVLFSNSTLAEQTSGVGDDLTSFNSNGFSIGANYNCAINLSNEPYASWTFRKQAKFFDVVTYTGNGTSGRTISHNLGSVPGCIIVKCTSTAGEYWAVYHRSIGATNYLWLQDTIAASTSSTYWNDTSPTSSVFSVGNDGSVNGNGKTYVAYLFAHDAGGFGATGSDNVISCGSFTTNASGVATVTLGYEPQWVLIKRTDGLSEWTMLDNMRGFSQTTDAWLRANSSAAESTAYTIATPTATGFVTDSTNIIDPSSTFIYIAIRRGPMKTPTTGTSVYTSSATTNTTGASITSNFPVDLAFDRPKAAGYNWQWQDRLRGNPLLQSNSTAAEFTPSPLLFSFDNNTAIKLNGYLDGEGNAHAWMFRRAPGFFDVVCYTGTGSVATVNHNLSVAPELMIVKRRSGVGLWAVYSAALGATKYLSLNATDASTTDVIWNDTAPTSSVFTVYPYTATGAAGSTYVAYLFATVAGVSKVGSYTGTGTTKQIDCGFTGGARFVLIKRTDSTGSWWVFDSARGIVPGNDPALQLNSTAAEVTTVDAVDADSIGFVVNQETTCNLNVNGGTYVFLAVS